MKNLADLLIEKNVFPGDIFENISIKKQTNGDIFEFLVSNGLATKEFLVAFIGDSIRNGYLTIYDLEEYPDSFAEDILKYIAKKLHIDFLDLNNIDINSKLASKVSLAQLKKLHALPIAENEINLIVALRDPLDVNAIESIQRLFPKKTIKVALSKSKQIEEYIYKLETSENIKELINDIRKDITSGATKEGEESPAIIKLIEIILKTAIVSRASDIHIEPTENNCIVRNRVDGILVESFLFDKDIFAPLSSRLKLLSNLDIAEKRKPQDGRFSAAINSKEYDFRISTLPISTGESIVMRILDKTKVMIRLEDAGISHSNYIKFTKALHVPYGIILVTGPTGSGKTTTLYGALNMLRSVKTKIITVEDPIEYQMNLVQQSQVQPKVGFTFATALRSILRQDPDIIMIGEIRDQETLRIAVQAALTGHLVLSTLHTNDSVSAITRMVDMGIEPYLVSGSLIAIEAQRLVRKICPYCKEKTTIPSTLLKEIERYLPPNFEFFKGKGCNQCSNTGYVGREMINEILIVSEEIASMIARGATKDEIARQAQKEGFETMLLDGLNKAMAGQTTIEEVMRVTKLS